LGLNLKKAGYFESFRSYFNYNGTQWGATTAANQWVTANTVTLYDKYGQELENKDALGRYSAAMFDFRGELPAAVASNAMNREIYSESFEDTRFTPACTEVEVSEGCEPVFKINGSTNLSANITSALVHSGNYSLNLTTTGIALTTKVHDLKTKEPAGFTYLTTNSTGEFITKTGADIYPVGFQPAPGKKYVFSAWVKDNQPESTSPGITVSVNGATITLTKKAVVEKWKQVEGIIDLPANTNNTTFTMQVKAISGTVNFDDMRIHPFDAHMKSYAYDEKTLRLMAEMDENNFATFYEYDDEGSLARVKKETERGIMTIKESRSSYRKAP